MIVIASAFLMLAITIGAVMLALQVYPHNPMWIPMGEYRTALLVTNDIDYQFLKVLQYDSSTDKWSLYEDEANFLANTATIYPIKYMFDTVEDASATATGMIVITTRPLTYVVMPEQQEENH
jgi:hypothetical protein